MGRAPTVTRRRNSSYVHWASAAWSCSRNQSRLAIRRPAIRDPGVLRVPAVISREQHRLVDVAELVSRDVQDQSVALKPGMSLEGFITLT